MIIVGNALVSEDILERKFACQLNACKGACCVQGDSGAPLENEEVEIIQSEFEQIKPFLDSERLALIEEKGFSTVDSDGDLGTLCQPSGECVFVVYTNNIAQCGIEQAYYAGKTWFKKPLSCHLYPIRAKKYGDYMALNYHNWEICAPACKAGAENQIPVHEFLREALTRKMGPVWYKELEQVANAWKKEG